MLGELKLQLVNDDLQLGTEFDAAVVEVPPPEEAEVRLCEVQGECLPSRLLAGTESKDRRAV
jgi:hypothetical protein